MRAIAISDAVKLAIHSMEFIARNANERWTTQRIADHFNASPHHLAKIHTRLVKDGLMNSIRGPRGGLSLARDPNSITLLDIVTSIDGDSPDSQCLFEKPVCGRKTCIFGSLIRDVNRQTRTYFNQTTLADLLE